MKILRMLLAIFLTLGVVNCILFRNIPILFLVLVFSFVLFVSVRANRKNKQNELSDIFSTSWFILCELIPLWCKFVYNIDIFQKFSLDRILTFIFMGPIISLYLIGFNIIPVKYED